MVTTLVTLSLILDYTINTLLMSQVEEEMVKEINHLEETIQKEVVDINREFREMGKLFSVVIAERPKGIIYMSAVDVKETEEIIRGYWEQNYTKKFDEISEEELEFKVDKKKFFTSRGFHMLVVSLPPNRYFPKNSYLCLLKDIKYIEKLRVTINILLFFSMIILGVLHLVTVNYALRKIFLALRGLNSFAGKMSGKSSLDFSERYEKKYGNKEVDELIDTLNKFIGKLEDTFGNMEEFSSNVSHELKTPMASMRSMIEVDLIQERSAEDYRETMVKILEEINWMNNLVKELLSLTKNPDGLKKNFKPIKVARLGNEICDLMEIMALDGGVELYWNFDEIEDTYIMCDAGSIKQVIMNLINNSIKYNRENGWIKVRGKQEDETIIIAIEDCGIGIKEENISKLTERFFREDNVRTHKKSGVGLGLSIVSHILQAHRGKLEITSKIGVGSTFIISFPKIEKIEVTKVESD